MRKLIIPRRDIGKILIPTDLADDVQALLRDPRTGRTRYGEMKRLILRLLANWVETQRAPAPAREPELLDL